jgi:single-strand DNA-binding protein
MFKYRLWLSGSLTFVSASPAGTGHPEITNCLTRKFYNYVRIEEWARFSIATHDVYRGANGEKVQETFWHNLVAWGKLAEIAEKYLGRGSEVAIEGKLVHRNYTDKEGVKHYVTEILVNEILMLGSKN